MWSVSGEHLVICGKDGGSRSMHCLVEMNFCYQLLVRDWHYPKQRNEAHTCFVR